MRAWGPLSAYSRVAAKKSRPGLDKTQLGYLAATEYNFISFLANHSVPASYQGVNWSWKKDLSEDAKQKLHWSDPAEGS